MGQIKVEKNVGGIEGLYVIEPAVHGDAAQSESTGNRCQPVWRDSRYIGCTATCKRKKHNHNGNRQCGRQQYCP